MVSQSKCEVIMMKRVNAVIRPEKLQDIKESLAEKGFFAMTIYNVKGRGAQKGICLQFRGKQTVVDMIPKVEISIVIKDDEVREVIDIIRKSGRTGKFGDGKIFISPVEMVASVRMDEEITE